MNEFDGLLYEVLREDSNQQIPPGMKNRILAALPHQTYLLPGHGSMWIGVAAAMLIGVFGIATWILVYTSSGPRVASDSDQSLLMRCANPLTLGEAGQTDVRSTAQKPDGRKSTLRRSIGNRLLSQQGSIRIAPVVIEPLAIRPIEIASMTPGGSTLKGKLR